MGSSENEETLAPNRQINGDPLGIALRNRLTHSRQFSYNHTLSHTLLTLLWHKVPLGSPSRRPGIPFPCLPISVAYYYYFVPLLSGPAA
jgi:hypothetical protein